MSGLRFVRVVLEVFLPAPPSSRGKADDHDAERKQHSSSDDVQCLEGQSVRSSLVEKQNTAEEENKSGWKGEIVSHVRTVMQQLRLGGMPGLAPTTWFEKLPHLSRRLVPDHIRRLIRLLHLTAARASRIRVALCGGFRNHDLGTAVTILTSVNLAVAHPHGQNARRFLPSVQARKDLRSWKAASERMASNRQTGSAMRLTATGRGSRRIPSHHHARPVEPRARPFEGLLQPRETTLYKIIINGT